MIKIFVTPDWLSGILRHRFSHFSLICNVIEEKNINGKILCIQVVDGVVMLLRKN